MSDAVGIKRPPIAYDHTTLNIRELVRSRKSSSVGPGQYLDRRRLGNPRCHVAHHEALEVDEVYGEEKADGSNVLHELKGVKSACYGVRTAGTGRWRGDGEAGRRGLINLPGWDLAAIKKAGNPWRGWDIALPLPADPCGSSELELWTQSRICCPMDSVPYLFTIEVTSRLESLEDLAKLGGVWTAATHKEASSRILCTLRLTSSGLYAFQRVGDGVILSLEEAKKLNPRNLRINRIVAIYDNNNVREVLLRHYTYMNPDVLLHLLDNAKPEVLRLQGGWPLPTLRLLFEKWETTSIRELRIEDYFVEPDNAVMLHCFRYWQPPDAPLAKLDHDLIEQIHKLWLDGFFNTRSLEVDFRATVSDRQLTSLFGQPTGEGLSKKWSVQNTLGKTFQLSYRRTMSVVAMRIQIS
uniref:FBA_2 domain-containing protein n=1 Tax=Steinernema glaseri TaxID=37863 RepID=A0A1I8AI15_9BILA